MWIAASNDESAYTKEIKKYNTFQNILTRPEFQLHAFAKGSYLIAMGADGTREDTAAMVPGLAIDMV